MNKKRKENQVMVYGKVEHLIQTEDIIFVLYCFRVLSERAAVCICSFDQGNVRKTPFSLFAVLFFSFNFFVFHNVLLKNPSEKTFCTRW